MLIKKDENREMNQKVKIQMGHPSIAGKGGLRSQENYGLRFRRDVAFSIQKNMPSFDWAKE